VCVDGISELGVGGGRSSKLGGGRNYCRRKRGGWSCRK
jgi:hypothetical protein